MNKKEISHYFVLFFDPALYIWIKDQRDSIETPFDKEIPIYLETAPLDLGTYWNNNAHNYFQNKAPSSLVRKFLEIGIPSFIVKEITFNHQKLTLSKIQEMSMDTDSDGLSDYLEVNVHNTQPNKIDSDQDGYSDYFELTQGYNPSDSNNPGNIIQSIIVDGVEDLKTFPIRGSFADPEKDQLKDNDLYYIKAYVEKGFLLVQTHFYQYQKSSKPRFHTLSIRTKDGRNLWLQGKGKTLQDKSGWQGNSWINFYEYKDGEPFKLWKPLNPINPQVQFADKDIFEFRIALESLQINDDFLMQYHVSSNISEKEWIFNSDSSDFFPVFIKPHLLSIDGKLNDWNNKFAVSSLIDPENDPKCDNHCYDLKTITAGFLAQNIYISAGFHNQVMHNKASIITLHFYFADTKNNYWLQFFGNQLINSFTFTDGTPYEKWSKMKNKELSEVYLNRYQEVEAEIPQSLFPELKQDKKMQLRIIMGGYKGKYSVWDSDDSPWLAVK
jgi:hypothetical protein